MTGIITTLLRRRISRFVSIQLLGLLLALTVVGSDTFDPSTIIMHYQGEESVAKLGWALTSLGDINGDGFDDIGMSSFDPPYTYVFFGGNPVDSFPDMYLSGCYGAAEPVDLDGDGLDDVVTSDCGCGTVYFFKGYGDSLASVAYDSIVQNTGICFGFKTRTGYIDGDNLGDLLTLAQNSPEVTPVYFYSGCPAIDKEPDWSYEVDNTYHTVSSLGFIDFDGDNWEDIFVGMLAGLNKDTLSYVYIFLGPDFGDNPDLVIGHPLDYDPSPVTPEYFAKAVANVGDVNGDGREDLGVIYYHQPFIYCCGPGADTLYDYRTAGFALAMSDAGDINGDGYNDLLTGDHRTMYGVVDLYLGGPNFDEDYDLSIYPWDLPPLFLENIGYSLSPAGDFNGDGYNDFVFACRSFTGGHVFVIAGGPYLKTGAPMGGEEILPARMRLKQNYPNPFNLSTRIEFSLAQSDRVTLDVFNVLGQKVIRLVDGQAYPAGYHTIDWDGRLCDNSSAPSGVYFCRLSTSSGGESRKMLLVK